MDQLEDHPGMDIDKTRSRVAPPSKVSARDMSKWRIDSGVLLKWIDIKKVIDDRQEVETRQKIQRPD